MSNRALVIAALAYACLLVACAKAPINTSETDNPEIKVSLLFEHDGCRVYRFVDERAHYFVRCSGVGVSTTMSPYFCGKGCVRDETIATVER